MQFIPYRDLWNGPSVLRKKLAAEGELIVIADSKPFTLIINLGDEDVQDILLIVSRLRTQMAVRSIRSHLGAPGRAQEDEHERYYCLDKKDPC